MAHDLKVIDAGKREQYESLFPQLKELVAYESDIIANMGNIAAALKQQFDWLWVGFYLVKDNELVLGPFQGPVACTRISPGKGVCGTSWTKRDTIIVKDVDNFPGHIACSSLSKSEIVVPIFQNDIVIGVLDVDSENLNHFDEEDSVWLNKIVELIFPNKQIND
ncbi:putative GAF sensor protein [Pseudopedobacter saltans DSM 12145]|uniref:GAF sensor protein n=1 Tax=Pseudopedobacter saltans (strain ATCC 51119 / DSM 12145 / JCM 21818 / CCUG 39354 / LMG 10337 / NBRC 100064 / NCIMB 13643) TaxID=762903 RepID=F0SAZ4_PSESL|nr:GAF domain-containing protein [Pseudopedobacter saltans]ADY51589.1 putative GAF sensor protein [Pseudopedobacter saltans DSM 12145]